MRRTALVVAVILAAACKLPPKPKGADAAKAAGYKGPAPMAPMSVDEPYLRQARAARSSFLESRTDCPVLGRGLPAALAELENAQTKTTTQGGHDSIESMKQEIRDAVADCSS